MQAYRAADMNMDGFIQLEEFKFSMQCMGFTIPDHEIQQRFNQFDTDGDGRLSMNEYESACETLNKERVKMVSDGPVYGKAATSRSLADQFDTTNQGPGPSYDQAPGPSYGQAPGPSYGQAPGPSYGQAPGPSYGQAPGPSYGQAPDPSYNQAPGQAPGPVYGQSGGAAYGQPVYGRQVSPVYEQQGSTQSASIMSNAPHYQQTAVLNSSLPSI